MFTTYRQRIGSLSRNTRLLLFSSALIGFAYVGIYVMLFNLYLSRLGYEPKFIGSINAVAQLGFALFSLPAGILGSRWGVRRMSIVGLGIAALGLGVLPFAEMLPTAWQSTWLMATYLLAWLGGGLYLVNSVPWLMEATSTTERDQVFSVRQALTPLAGFGGSLTGGFLPGLFEQVIPAGHQVLPYRLALFVGAALLIPGVLALIATDEVKTAPKQAGPVQPASKAKAPLPIGMITFMALIIFLLVAGNSTAGIFFNLYLDDGLQLPTTRIGMLAALGQLLGGPVALLTPLAIIRWGKGRTITLGIYGLAVGLLPLAFAGHWAIAGFGFISVTALFSFVIPALTVCQQEIVPPQWRSTMAGAVSMATGLSRAAMALGGGHLITTYGYQSLFLTGASLAAIGATLFWGYTWLPRWVLTSRLNLRSTMNA